MSTASGMGIWAPTSPLTTGTSKVVDPATEHAGQTTGLTMASTASCGAASCAAVGRGTTIATSSAAASAAKA